MIKKLRVSSKKLKMIETLWFCICIFITFSLTDKYNWKFYVFICLAVILEILREFLIRKFFETIK